MIIPFDGNRMGPQDRPLLYCKIARESMCWRRGDDNTGSRQLCNKPAYCFGVILAPKDCATILPSRTTNVSVAAS
jgi:hypothetical protein